MRILVTGAVGFIGYHTCLRLLQHGDRVLGVDNINRYFAPSLKEERLVELLKYPEFRYAEADLADRDQVQAIFFEDQFRTVIHLAGQAGVRYSIANPQKFIRDNIVGFSNVIEYSRQRGVLHFLYASSSSVYNGNDTSASKETDCTDFPASLYAATKKSNEVIAQSYSHLYCMKSTGLRFFTVYGPYGRPDMAAWIFTDAILEGKSFDVFNYGECKRDFTYIDDVVECILRLMDTRTGRGHEIYNVGNTRPVFMTDVIYTLEKLTGKKALCNMREHQTGDSLVTWADTEKLKKEIHFTPNTDIQDGLQKFVEWFIAWKALRNRHDTKSSMDATTEVSA